MTYGGFWIRVAAYLIDAILLGIISGILTLGADDRTTASGGVSTLLGWLYFAILLGAIFLGEQLAPQDFIGLALIALGLAAIDGRLVSALQRRRAAPQAAS